MSVLLASGSPRRRELLTRLGIPFTVEPTGVDERDPRPGEEPQLYALELARTKAVAALHQHPDRVVLAADTVVAIGGSILNKPLDEGDALRMLSFLRGRRHRVVTAVVVACGDAIHMGTESSDVFMRAFDDAEAVTYIRTGEPMDKAGAYAVQGGGGRLVDKVVGCFDNVVGLPLCVVESLLKQCDVLPEDFRGPACIHGSNGG